MLSWKSRQNIQVEMSGGCRKVRVQRGGKDSAEHVYLEHAPGAKKGCDHQERVCTNQEHQAQNVRNGKF